MAVLADGPAGERLDALLDRTIERLEIDCYYFGVRIARGASYHSVQNARDDVLDKLIAWKKDEPRSWHPRSYKPYFNDHARKLQSGLVGGVTRGGVKGASSASP